MRHGIQLEYFPPFSKNAYKKNLFNPKMKMIITNQANLKLMKRFDENYTFALWRDLGISKTYDPASRNL